MAARGAGVSLAKITADLVQTDEIRGKARTALKVFLADLDRWRAQAANMRHDELAEMVLDESGYTGMLKGDKSPQAQGRLENLKELIRSMGGFETLEAYLEHVALVMDLERADTGDEVWLMTLHAAKGLEFPMVFLPGWEETVFPSQRSLDEKGAAALEEERRLAYVGLTRAREKAVISFAANRQIFGRWQSVLPSRFVDELPADHVDAGADTGYFGADSAGYGGLAEPMNPSASTYDSPGWRRLQNAQAGDRGRRAPPTIDGEARLVATEDGDSSFSIGERVFHIKFGYGRIARIDGNKVEVDFEKAGRKKVIESFLERH
jgi:DNA helicase-2/ATP-dependent DNA helicase PcrA